MGKLCFETGQNLAAALAKIKELEGRSFLGKGTWVHALADGSTFLSARQLV